MESKYIKLESHLSLHLVHALHQEQDLHHLHSPGHEARPYPRVPLRRRGHHSEEVGQVKEAGQASLELALLIMLPRTEVQGVTFLVVLQQGLEIII